MSKKGSRSFEVGSIGYIVIEEILGVMDEIFLIEMTAIPSFVRLGVSSIKRRVLY